MAILSDADPAELNYMLPKVGLGLLFYKIKDHSPTKLHRTSLLDLLAVTRISVRLIMEKPVASSKADWWLLPSCFFFLKYTAVIFVWCAVQCAMLPRVVALRVCDLHVPPLVHPISRWFLKGPERYITSPCA